MSSYTEFAFSVGDFEGVLVAHLYVNVLNYKRILPWTEPPTTERSSSLTRMDVIRRHSRSATSMRRKNKNTLHRNLLRCIIGAIGETFCNTNADLWAPWVVTLKDLVLLL